MSYSCGILLAKITIGMYSALEPPVKTKNSVDWFKAKMLYVEDNTVSYSDIAQMFDVSLKSVKKHGSRDEWVGVRQEVAENVETKIKENLVNERVEANERHRKQYHQLQDMIRQYMVIIQNHNKAVIEKAKTEGRIVNPKQLYSAQNLLNLTKTLMKVIDGERVTLGLPIVVVAPPGWKPQHQHFE